MIALPIILLVIVCLIGMIWTSRHIMIWRQRNTTSHLREDSPGPPADAPMISVILAAKDEAHNIDSCVRSMLDQDYPNFEMIVCNDRSDDATGEIAEGIAAENDRLTVINIEELTEGWSGKNHAMHAGIAKARGEWICMIDADCRQTSRRTLSVSLQHAIDRQADMLSIMPVLEMKGFWENVVQPVCGGILMIWFHPDKVNDQSRSNAYANGAFMLIKRTAYDAIGGHEAIKSYINEDVKLAANIKEAGLVLKVAQSSGLFLSRMYTSLGDIVRGWGRIFYASFITLKRTVISLAVLTIVSLSPYLLAVVGLSLGLAGVGPAGLWLAVGVAGAVVAAIQISVIYRFYKLIGAKEMLAWTYPIGCLVAVVSLCISISKFRKGAKVVWRSTVYTVHDR